MKIKRAFIKVLIRMAMADKKLVLGEFQVLKNLQADLEFSDVDIALLIKEAENQTLEEIIAPIHKYEDRLFTVQHAYYLATVDKEFHEEEKALFKELLENFQVTKEDLDRVGRSAVKIAEGRYDALTDPDLAYLHNNYMQSTLSGDLLD